MNQADRPDGQRVIIYRDRLLPFSETFILDQAQALCHHDPLFVGRRVIDGISLDRGAVATVANGDSRTRARELRHLFSFPPGDLVNALADTHPVLIHAHFGPDAVNALALQRRLGVPLIVTFHGYDATQDVSVRQGPAMWLYGRRRPALARRATLVLAVSEHIRRCLIALGFPADRVRRHYIGVDLARFSVAPLALREPVVLAVGRFVEKKGFENLIDAMAEVQRQVPASELVIIGSGPLGPQLRARAAARLGKHRILGPCNRDEVASWMARARVLAVPSVTSRSGDTEGLPIVVLEALASGLPIVASRHAGIPEAVEDGGSGYLVPEGDLLALARRIIDVLTDDAVWHRLSASARATAERKFELRAQTRKLEAIYDEVREQASNRGPGAEASQEKRRSERHARPPAPIPCPAWGAHRRVGR